VFEIKIDYDDVWLHSLSNGNLLSLSLFEKESLKPTGSVSIQFSKEYDIIELCKTMLNALESPIEKIKEIDFEEFDCICGEKDEFDQLLCCLPFECEIAFCPVKRLIRLFDTTVRKEE